MDYNFDELVNRKNTNSLKYATDEVQMWVADMDFKVAPCIQEALQKRLDHAIFGYTQVDEKLFESVLKWWSKRHGVDFDKESLLFANGVVPSLGAMLRALSNKGDKILVQSPVYHAFYHIIKQNERAVLENQLIYKNGLYSVDFKDLEQKFKEQKPKLMILCNPHNPIGKIYTKEELRLISKLCKAYKVLLISDEIHCDLSQSPYTSMFKLDEQAIITLSITKAFNLAGLSGSFSVIKDKKLRLKVQAEIAKAGIYMPNPFFVSACKAALSKQGQSWLKQLNSYIKANKNYAYDFIEQNSPVKVVRSEALYMIWLDCSAFCKDTSEFYSFLRKDFKLHLSNGKDFGLGGQSFLRLNLACPRTNLEKGLKLFVRAVKAYIKMKNKVC